MPASPLQSAGILLYRSRADGALEVLLVHPGGPFWTRRDAGVWSIPKGEHGSEEPPFEAARREFAEELGVAAPRGAADDLGEVRQRAGKVVRAWAIRGDVDTATIESNTFTLEWPPRSGVSREFPEVDRAEWFTLERAREKINPAQVELLDRLARLRAAEGPTL
jgi:predicted NUDIX family NTP pyrophosphohydrolase